MKTFILISAILLTTYTSIANPPKTFRLVVKFNSKCCGVPDAVPLLKTINFFKKKNKIKKLSYYHVGPMGREGEYYMAFPLTELNKKQTALFIKEVNATTEKMKEKGNATTEENMEINRESLTGRSTITKKFL